MDVMSFDSPGSMREHLAAAINARLHPLQAAMRPGDYWADFRDVTSRDVRFGWISEDEELLNLLRDSGMTEDVAAATLENLHAGHALGVFYGQRFDARRPGGIFDVVYAGRVWPIEERLYDAASEVDFDIDRLPEWGKVLLQAAFIASRHHRKNRGQ